MAHLVAVLEFCAGRLSGERLYAGDALLRMMFGPLLDVTTAAPPPS